MRETIIRHSIITAVFLLIGIIVYFFLNFLLKLPGDNTIDRLYETEEEKIQRKAGKKSITKVYIITLIWLIIAANLYIYFIH